MGSSCESVKIDGQMKIGFYHGYELSGSGSNEFTRYFSQVLTEMRHEVHVFCREPNPSTIPHIKGAYEWTLEGQKVTLYEKEQSGPGVCTLHRLPHGKARPVFLTDKQREGNVKAFIDLSN